MNRSQKDHVSKNETFQTDRRIDRRADPLYRRGPLLLKTASTLHVMYENNFNIKIVLSPTDQIKQRHRY